MTPASTGESTCGQEGANSSMITPPPMRAKMLNVTSNMPAHEQLGCHLAMAPNTNNLAPGSLMRRSASCPPGGGDAQQQKPPQWNNSNVQDSTQNNYCPGEGYTPQPL